MKKIHIVPGLCCVLFLIFGISSYSLALEVPVFSPLRYSIDNVQGTAVYTDTVTMGNVVSGEFHLIVQNGSGGANKVDYAEVYVAGKRLVKMKSTKDLIDKKFKLVQDSEMRIQLTGPKNSFVVVSVIAKKLTQVPLVIRMSQANAQATMTNALLKIKKKPLFSSHGFVPTGSVISQIPRAGTYVKEKTKASITVSTGPDLFYALLPGTPETPASSAVVDYSNHDTITDTEVTEVAPGVRIARTKLEIGFTSTATVGVMNALLTSIGAQITAMLKGVNQVIVRIPDPGTLENLDTLVAQIKDSPIVRYVLKAYMPSPDSLPPNVDVVSTPSLEDRIDHHLDVRAHAAWNVRGLLQDAQRPYLIVADWFGDGQPNSDFAVTSDWRDFTTASPDDHGYHVLGIIAATFGGDATERGMATGMYPGPLLLWAVDMQKVIDYSTMDNMIHHLVSLLGGNIIVNTSLYRACSADFHDKSCLESAALSWIEKVRGSALHATGQWGAESLENTFIHLTSAGNIKPDAITDTDAALNSHFNAARLLTTLAITETSTHVFNLNNTLVIENREKSAVPLEGLSCIRPTSKYPGDLSAIGTNVFSLAGASTGTDYISGTSQATPQVAGLAAYLWALKPWAAPQGIIDILMHTADTSSCGYPLIDPKPLIDAYAAVLAIDRGYSDARVRRTLLDVADRSGVSGTDQHFTEKDIELFLAYFEYANGKKDYSRYDLNGDGKTGGDSKAKFNLNMDYPFTYTSVSQTIEGNSVNFDENSLTDLDILCYYAYSPLYTGDTDKRKDLLGEKCGKEPSVDVTWVRLTDLASKQTSSGDELICNQNQFLGDSTSDTPLPLPISLFASCPPYNDSTATFGQVSPGHVTVAFSGSGTKVRIPVPPPDPWGYYVVTAEPSTAAYGVILTAGTYTVDITPQLTYNPNPPSGDQTFGLNFDVYFVGGGEDSLNCKSIAYPDNPYSECCRKTASGNTCGPVGNLSYDIDIPEQGMNHWWFSVGMAPGKHWWHVPPEDISISGQVLSIKPKK